jgi:hypothetical protein
MAAEDVIADAALRELGAQARTFTSVAGALLWYAEQRARRSGRAIPLESGSTRSQEDRDRVEATYAAIVGCLTAAAPEDWEPTVLREEDVEALVAWYEVHFAEYACTSDEERAKSRLARRLRTRWDELCRMSATRATCSGAACRPAGSSARSWRGTGDHAPRGRRAEAGAQGTRRGRARRRPGPLKHDAGGARPAGRTARRPGPRAGALPE